MADHVNRQIVLASRPTGWPNDSNFRLEEAPVPEPGAGQFLVRNSYMSVDPYMRGRMVERKSYIAPFQIGKPLEGSAVGRVIKSSNPQFAEGDWVSSMQGWREYYASSGQGVQKLPAGVAPPSAFLGVLGIPGFTGWYGLREIGKPKAGETLVVSAAAGATGSLVGQLGKVLGCRVVGVAGGEEKCAFITKELGFDAAVDYKKGKVFESLQAACPKGIDIYFENVGGETLDAVLRLINPFARIPFCGMISQYNKEIPDPGPRFLFAMIPNRALMQGFIISDHLDKFMAFVGEVGALVKSGRIKYAETVLEGIENAPKAFIGLLRGENKGKMLVKIGPAE